MTRTIGRGISLVIIAVMIALCMVATSAKSAHADEPKVVKITNGGVETNYSLDEFAIFINTTGIQANSQVTLLADITIDHQYIPVDAANISFNLNGHYLDRNDYTTTPGGAPAIQIGLGGSLTVEDSVGGGYIKARNCILVNSGGSLLVESGEFRAGAVGAGSCVWVYAGGTLDITGGSFSANNQNIVSAGTTTISNVTLTSSEQDYGYSIILNAGSMTLNNVTVTANGGGVAVNGGILEINGGSYSAGKFYGVWVTNSSNAGIVNGPNTKVTVNSGTFYGARYGLYSAVDDTSVQRGPVEIEITGGSFSGGTAAIALSQTNTSQFELDVSGGEYSTDVTEYIVPGKAELVKASGTPQRYTIIEDSNVAADAAGAVAKVFVNGTVTYYAVQGEADAAAEAAGGVVVEEAIRVTVLLNANNGSVVSSTTVVNGTPIAKPADPVRSGYVFAGWFSDSALTVPYNFSAGVTTPLTLYAKWDPVASPVPSGGGSGTLANTGDTYGFGLAVQCAFVALLSAGFVAVSVRKTASKKRTY